jgi:hypothetical protein
MVMFTLAIAVPSLFLGWGLWRLRLWAWWLQVVLILLPFTLLLAGFIVADGLSQSYLWETVILLAPGAAILAYFMTEPIRSAFGISANYPAGTVMR